MADVTTSPHHAKKTVRIAASDPAADANKKSAQFSPDEHGDEKDRQGNVNNRRQKRILVAMDESQESIRALRYFLDTVFQPGDMAVLLHSQPLSQNYVGPGGPGFYINPDLVAATKQHQESVSKMVLEKAKKICDEAQVKTELVIATGDPRDCICDAVEKTHADLLVMGSRGHSAIKRTFLGSVSDYCAHNAKCAVLIVK